MQGRSRFWPHTPVQPPKCAFDRESSGAPDRTTRILEASLRSGQAVATNSSMQRRDLVAATSELSDILRLSRKIGDRGTEADARYSLAVISEKRGKRRSRERSPSVC
jgi:hypothetical protein